MNDSTPTHLRHCNARWLWLLATQHTLLGTGSALLHTKPALCLSTTHLGMEGPHLLWSEVVLHHCAGLEDGDASVRPHALIMHRNNSLTVRCHTRVALATQVDAKRRVLQ